MSADSVWCAAFLQCEGQQNVAPFDFENIHPKGVRALHDLHTDATVAEH